MSQSGQFSKKVIGTISFAGLLVLAGCATSIPAKSVELPQGLRPDGRYDNNNYLVDSYRMDLARVMQSLVILETKALFQNEDEELVSQDLTGTGVVVGGRFVLTAEHVVSIPKITAMTPFGPIEVSAEKLSEDIYVRWHDKQYPVRVVYKDHAGDVALLELPSGVRPPSFPFTLGDSDDLRVGNYVYVVGNPLNMGFNVREGIVSALQAPHEVDSIEAKSENTFMVSNGLVPGDSGTPVIAIRDGRFELVGISQGTFTVNNRLGWVIRINAIRDMLESAGTLASEGWLHRPASARLAPVPVSVRSTRAYGLPDF